MKPYLKINRQKLICCAITACILSIFPVQLLHAGKLDKCIMEAVKQADNDNITLGEMRLLCEQQIQLETSTPQIEDEEQLPIVQERIREEEEHALKPFILMAHKPNYMLVASYNSNSYNPELFQERLGDDSYSLDDVEAHFQISFKFPLLLNLFDDKADIYAAYTNRSFWQVYNQKESSPFRETNHEPEAWIQFNPNWELFGFTNVWNSFGIVHQSNGRGGNLSRSWNRVYGWFTVERGNLALSVKPWLRIQENSEDDNNPDITDYLGHYELSGSYKWQEHVFSVMSRNNLESGFKRGAVEVSWSFPIPKWPYLKGYVQYFGGYGESLIDYNNYVNRIGVGVSLTDWL